MYRSTLHGYQWPSRRGKFRNDNNKKKKNDEDKNALLTNLM